jgi:cytochrome o ubiquinol oxidase subunit II
VAGSTGRHRRQGLRSFACLAALSLSGCAGGILDPKGPIGGAERIILLDSLAIMLAIVIPTIAVTLGFAWWYRESNQKARYRPDFVYSGAIELVVWSIPTLVILFLGGIIWIGSYELDPYRPIPSDKKPLEVQVVSLDWKWLFLYPEHGVAAVNQLVVPAGTPVHFALTSASVMNTFFVPQLGSMIYTMNGMTTQLHLQADHEGSYYGRSAHFSGDGFPDMQFTVKAVSDADFNAWIEAAKASQATLDQASYAALAKQSIGDPPKTFRLGDPHLFHQVATQALPPGPGPEEGRPTADVSNRSGG